MIALGYIRVSTQEQAEQGISLDAQQAALLRLASARGLTLAPEDIYQDAGISGTTLDRPGLQALLDRIAGNRRARNGNRIAAVLVTKLDRLSRDTYDGIGLSVQIQAAGCALITLEDGEIDRTDPMAELMHTLRLAVARFEVRQTAARVRFALARKRERGERAGTVPYGFRLVNEESDLLESDPHEQQVIGLLHELRPGRSMRQVAEELNRQGYRTRAGSEWRMEYVRNLIRRSV